MQTHSGILKLTKTEKKEIELLLDHAEKDVSFLHAGTYHLPNGRLDTRSTEKAKRAIQNIRWILGRV